MIILVFFFLWLLHIIRYFTVFFTENGKFSIVTVTTTQHYADDAIIFRNRDLEANLRSFKNRNPACQRNYTLGQVSPGLDFKLNILKYRIDKSLEIIILLLFNISLLYRLIILYSLILSNYIHNSYSLGKRLNKKINLFILIRYFHFYFFIWPGLMKMYIYDILKHYSLSVHFEHASLD